MARRGVQVTINVRVDGYSWAVTGSHRQGCSLSATHASLALRNLDCAIISLPFPLHLNHRTDGFSDARGITGESSLPIRSANNANNLSSVA